MIKLARQYSKIHNISFKQALTLVKREQYVKQLVERRAK